MEAVTEFLKKLASKGIKLSSDAGGLNCYAQKGALTSDLRDGITRFRTEIMALLEVRKERLSPEVHGGPRDKAIDNVLRPVDRSRYERLPLSFAQERLWFINQIEPDSIAYNVPFGVTFKGELDIGHLDQALSLIIARHENLRTVFPSQDGQAQQLILDNIDFRLERIDLSHYKRRGERNEEARRLCQAGVAALFDLARGPLLRGKVIKLGDHEHILMLYMHHIVSDGWSIQVLIKELGLIMEAFRRGGLPELAPLPIQYVDYSVWQRTWLEEKGILKQQLGYWQKKLAGVPETLDLATDYPRPSVQSTAGATYAFVLDAQLSGQIKTLARQQRRTLFMVLLAAFKVLLYRYTGQSDICVGSPIANRQHGETEGLIGMFVNTLALRTSIDGDDTFVELLSQIKTTCLEAYEHQDTPFEKVVDLLRPGRNLAISPIFQVMVVLHNASVGERDERIDGYLVENSISKFDLTAAFMESPEGLAGWIEYRTALYKPQTVARMAAHFIALCRAIIAAPTARICDLDYIGEAEKRKLLLTFNDTETDYPRDKCIHELFAERVVIHPGRTAVVVGEQELTYQGLDDKSHDLALYLQSIGVKPGSLVGLCVERSLDMVVGLLGILRAGGAYLPLDPGYPAERLAYILQDSQSTIVLTNKKVEGTLTALVKADTRIVALDQQWKEICDHVARLKAERVQLQQQVRPNNLAYVIYTSGSTGKPKGVEVTHGSVVNLLCSMRLKLHISQRDTVLAVTTLSFDIAALELYLPLVVGGRLVVATQQTASDGAQLLARLRSCGATVLQGTPVTWRLLLEAGWNADPALTMVCGGEALPRDLANQLLETGCPLWNMYGPTETTIWSSASRVEPGDGPVSLGSPIGNTQIYILDQYDHLQPIGVPGELHIAGDGLARSYLNRPELTHEKFVANPFQPGTRMYKTGDLARWLDDGNIQYLGRLDTQVKIRGFRIELGEIEAQLNQYPGIHDSAVIAQGQAADKRLIAFYLLKDSTAENVVHLPKDLLRAHLSKILPEYMLPSAYVSLAAIPLQPNGKVDRRYLANMDVESASLQEYVAPRTDTEHQLIGIWAQVLKLAPEKIGVEDSFFDLGGHSLLATRLIAKIRSGLGIDLPLKALFERPSVVEFAKLVPQAAKSDIPQLQPVDRSRYDRLPLSFGQERLWFINQLEPDSIAYNLPLAITIRGELDTDHLDQALNLIIARHEILRTAFPSQDGQAHQLILDSLDFRLERMDLSQYESREEGNEEAKRLCQAGAATLFDLARGPLLRGKVIKVAEHEHILMLSMHHIVSDGWSLGVLIKELGSIMEALRHGRPPELAPLPIQYVDYSVWQRTWLEEGGMLKQQLAYWKKKLTGVPESLDLATDHPRPNIRSLAGATYAFTLDAQLSAQLKSVAQRRGSTLFMVLLAAFKVLLYRYTGQNDICVGSPIANRQYGETEGLIGMFVNTLALRSRVEGEDTFAALLSQVKATCLQAYEHQDAPFEKVVDMLRPQRNLAVSPIFQVLVILQNADMREPDERIRDYSLQSDISKFDLTAAFCEIPEGLAGWFEYSTALYKPQTIERMAGHFVALCRAITVAPTTRIRDLDYIGEVEKHKLIRACNDPEVTDHPRPKCIHELFVEQVGIHPNRTAVVFGVQVLTYQELYDKSYDLALYLQSIGVKPDSLVGLCLERSLDMLVGLLGILLAGGAYVPLDPDYPADRLAYMLQDSQATIVLTQKKLQVKLTSLAASDTRIVALDQHWKEIGDCAAELKAKSFHLQQDVKPNDLAYVIYTSGSTGKPKGVMVEHANVVRLFRATDAWFGFNENDVWTLFHSYAFDFSVWEIWGALLYGGCLLVVPKEIVRSPQDFYKLLCLRKVTVLNQTPSAFRQLITAQADSEQQHYLRYVIFGGEALEVAALKPWFERNPPHTRLVNMYGITETTVHVTYRPLEPADAEQRGASLIGVTIPDLRTYILDSQRKPVPIGVAGELYVSGAGVARGYLHRQELTQEKFVANPFQPGTRMYKTGDLARWLDDGDMQYLGRLDTQVKIRGFRIELGEIEAQLNQHPGIQDSAVIAQGQAADKRLIAFYCAKGTTTEHLVHLPNDSLRLYLSSTLPEYMVPAAFLSLAAIPLDPNGKVDRGSLANMDVTIASGRDYVAPRTATEKQLVGIWAEVLKLAPGKIGVEDSFFELGGHSLLAVILIERMRQQGLYANLQTLFTEPTLAKLAAAIERGRDLDVSAPETVPDLEQEATLDETIELRTEGSLGEMRNALLTGATGGLGAFLLSELLVQTRANIYCLVRAASTEAGYRKIEECMKSFGLWDPAVSKRILPVVGDLARPLLGLTPNKFKELATVIDVIYHNGAAINFYYPYSWHKAANVLSTEELLRLASMGRSKSLHFVSTLGVALAQVQGASRLVINENEPLPGAPNLSDGYVQSKWVAEKIVGIASSRGIPVVTYRPGTIMGHSETGAANLEDFVSSFIRGCMQTGCIPEGEVHEELHLVPVDYVSRCIVALSMSKEFFGRVFNLTLTNPHGITGRELLDSLLKFDPTLQQVSYEEWRSEVAADAGNAFSRHIASFPDRRPEDELRSVRPQFDSDETLRIVEAAGIVRPNINQQLLETYFSYIAKHTTSRAAVGTR